MHIVCRCSIVKLKTNMNISEFIEDIAADAYDFGKNICALFHKTNYDEIGDSFIDILNLFILWKKVDLSNFENIKEQTNIIENLSCLAEDCYDALQNSIPKIKSHFEDILFNKIEDVRDFCPEEKLLINYALDVSGSNLEEQYPALYERLQIKSEDFEKFRKHFDNIDKYKEFVSEVLGFRLMDLEVIYFDTIRYKSIVLDEKFSSQSIENSKTKQTNNKDPHNLTSYILKEELRPENNDDIVPMSLCNEIHEIVDNVIFKPISGILFAMFLNVHELKSEEYPVIKKDRELDAMYLIYRISKTLNYSKSQKALWINEIISKIDIDDSRYKKHCYDRKSSDRAVIRRIIKLFDNYEA